MEGVSGLLRCVHLSGHEWQVQLCDVMGMPPAHPPAAPVPLQVKENKDKIKLNNQLPYLVGNVVEVLEMQPEEDEEEDGAAVDLDSQRRGKCVVLKTSTRQTIFLPVVGLVDADALKPADLVGVNKVISPGAYIVPAQAWAAGWHMHAHGRCRPLGAPAQPSGAVRGALCAQHPCRIAAAQVGAPLREGNATAQQRAKRVGCLCGRWLRRHPLAAPDQDLVPDPDMLLAKHDSRVEAMEVYEKLSAGVG